MARNREMVKAIRTVIQNQLLSDNYQNIQNSAMIYTTIPRAVFPEGSNGIWG